MKKSIGTWVGEFCVAALLLAGCGESGVGVGGDACATFDGSWYTSTASFSAAVGATETVDFETKGDRATVPSAGTDVPVDEYLNCCGILVEFGGTDPTGSLIWAGNPTGGFALRASCVGSSGCGGGGPNTVKVTFVNGASAAGGMQSATSYTAYMHDDSGEIASMTGSEWLGYASATTITYARFGRADAANLKSVTYQACP